MMKALFILLASLLLPYYARANNEVTVLCYHTFLGKKNIPTDFSLEEFKQHMTTLRSAGYAFLTLEAVIAGQVSGSRNRLMTFDDGHATAVTAYEQELAPWKLPAVFAIYPGTIEHGGAMSWQQLRTLVAVPGNAIVSHGYWHEKLLDKFAQKKPKLFVDEIEKSKKVLQDKLGITVTSFVYPYGVISASAKEQLKKSGYLFAFGLVQKPLQIPLEKNPDLLALPRWMMTRPIADRIIKQLTAK
jgi:peptidoglycan/xylan/chitin deacetylase (PgdA/CDA1 family)